MRAEGEVKANRTVSIIVVVIFLLFGGAWGLQEIDRRAVVSEDVVETTKTKIVAVVPTTDWNKRATTVAAATERIEQKAKDEAAQEVKATQGARGTKISQRLGPTLTPYFATREARSTREALRTRKALSTREASIQAAVIKTAQAQKTALGTAPAQERQTQGAAEVQATSQAQKAVQALEEESKARVNISSLNVRAGPGAGYSILTILYESENRTPTGYNEDQSWIQILLDENQKGWVAADFVTLENVNELATVTDYEKLPTPEPILPTWTAETWPTWTPEPILPTWTAETWPTWTPQPVWPTWTAETWPTWTPQPVWPTWTTAPATAGYTGPYDPFGSDRDCGHFTRWRDAQAFYKAAGGPGRDQHRLDRDRDGVACESLP